MTQNGASLSDQDFFYSHLTEYMDGELSAGDASRFQKLLAEEAYRDVPDHFNQQRGMLQLKLQSLTLSNKQRIMLQNKVRTQEATETIEVHKIEEVASTVAKSNFQRGFGFSILILCLCYICYYIFSPPAKKVFKPLDALSYEAIAMDQDPSGSRLSLPSTDPQEIRAFFKNTPGLTFRPQVLENLPAGWKPNGASLIDYEIAKITVAQYSNQQTEHRVFLFSLTGNIEKLPASNAVPNNGLLIQPYASDRINLVAWQVDKHTLAILAGRLSVRDLVTLAGANANQN